MPRLKLRADISLSERARLVHPWPLIAPTSRIASLYYLADLSSSSLVSPFLLALSFFSLVLFRLVCVRVLGAQHRG